MGSGRLDGLGQAGSGQARPGQVALGQAAGPGQTGPGQAGPGRRYIINKIARFKSKICHEKVQNVLEKNAIATRCIAHSVVHLILKYKFHLNL